MQQEVEEWQGKASQHDPGGQKLEFSPIDTTQENLDLKRTLDIDPS